jgi:hypothetical protein
VSRIRFSGQHLMNLCMSTISAVVVIMALRWPFKTALFPVVIGSCVFMMSFAELWLSLFEKEGAKKHSAMDFKMSEDVEASVALRRTLISFAWILGFFLLILLLGFTIAIPLYVFLYVKIQGNEKWLLSILMAAFSWFFFWGLFIWLLDTPMMEGWFFRILRAIGIGS